MTTLDQGGIENFLMNVYRAIDRDKVQFDFLVHRPWEGYFEAEAKELGARIYRVPPANPLSLRYARALDVFFCEHPYEVVHCHLNSLAAEPLRFARKYGARVRIAHSHASREDLDLKYPVRLAEKRRIPREATHLFACSKEAGDWQFGKHPFEVVRNAIDTRAFAFDPAVREAMRAELGIKPEQHVVLHVGRFSPVKNHRRILDVFGGLCKSAPDSRLLLVGEGALREEVEADSRSLGLSDRVLFLGVRRDIAALMCASDAFLMPSLYEGLPLVLVEAQASGLPCVVSDAVSCESRITELVSFVSLDEADEAWAGELIESFHRSNERVERFQEVAHTGFDVNYLSDRLPQLYLEAA